MNNKDINIGQNIRYIAEIRHYKAVFIAKQLDITPIRYNAILRANNVNITTLHNIASILNIDTYVLLLPDTSLIDRYINNQAEDKKEIDPNNNVPGSSVFCPYCNNRLHLYISKE